MQIGMCSVQFQFPIHVRLSPVMILIRFINYVLDNFRACAVPLRSVFLVSEHVVPSFESKLCEINCLHEVFGVLKSSCDS